MEPAVKKKSRSSGRKKREQEMARREAEMISNGLSVVGANDPEHEGRRQATKEEIDSLITFIGGFWCWSQLKNDCRKHVIQFLDFESQQSLKMCSRREYRTVDEVPCHLYSMEILQDPFLDHKNKGRETMITFQFGNKDAKIHRLLFCTTLNAVLVVTVLDKLRMLSHNWTIPNTNHRVVAMKMAENFIKKGRFHVEQLTVKVGSYKFQDSIIKKLPDLKVLKVKTDDIYAFRWWIHKIPEQMEYLEFEQYEDAGVPPPVNFSQTFMKLPQIINAPKITLYFNNAVNDEQFLNMTAPQFCINANLITDKGLNTFLQRWALGKGVEGFEQFVTQKISKELNWEKILEGLGYTAWREDYLQGLRYNFTRNHSTQFGSAKIYQVSSRLNPYDSLTVGLLSDHTIVVERSGFKETRSNGDEYAEYRSPKPIFPNPMWSVCYHIDD